MSINYLITGANRGIGLALTEEVLKYNGNVIGLCRGSSNMDDLVSLKDAYPEKVSIYEADVMNEGALIDVSKNIDELDVLICNAGIMGARGDMLSLIHI